MYGNLMRLVEEVDVKKVAGKDGNDRSVLNNRVAIDVGVDNTVFVDVVAWGGTAELIGKYLSKGDEFYGEGELRNTNYYVKGAEGCEGKEIKVIGLILTNIRFTHGKKKKAE